MKLKVYADRMSQPVRAVIIFCKLNGIDYEEVRVDISKLQHLTPEYSEINPMNQLPAIVDGRFKLFESHAILIYLACSYPGIPDHWYPADVCKRSQIHSVLDWHHSNLRRGPGIIYQNTIPVPELGRVFNPEAVAEGEKFLSASLSKIESFWLKNDGQFLLGMNKPSIADLSLVCDIMQLEVLDKADRDRLLGPYKKVEQWMENTRNSANPHFDQVHKILIKVKEKRQNLRLKGANNESGGSSMKKPLLSSI